MFIDTSENTITFKTLELQRPSKDKNCSDVSTLNSNFTITEQNTISRNLNGCIIMCMGKQQLAIAMIIIN